MRRMLCFALCALVGVAAAAQAPQPTWQYNSPSRILFEPTLGGDGSVYFATEDGKLRALNAKGVPLWSVKPGGQVITPIVLNAGLLLFGNSSQEIRAYGRNGSLAWKTKIGLNTATPLAVSADGYAYFCTTDGDLYSLNALSGGVRWHFHLGYQVGPPTVGHDGTIYVAGENFVHAVNPVNGHVIWRKNFFNFSRVPIAMDNYDDLFYNRQGIFDVYDTNGNFLWEARDDQGALLLVAQVPPVILDDLVIVTAKGGGNIFALDVSTGAIVWNFTDVNTLWTPAPGGSMAVSRDGIVTYNDTTGVIAWFDGYTGAFYGYMPSIGSAGDVTLMGNGLKGVAVILSGTNRNSLVAYTPPTGPASGPWNQGPSTCRHLMRRDDAPYVSLSSPADGAVITGKFTANATAADDFNLTGLDLYIENTLVASGTNGFLQWAADSAAFQDGTYVLTALATDNAGNQGVSQATVTFVNPTPVYALSAGPPTFTWLNNGVDNKYQVAIAWDPGFSNIITTSATSQKKFVKGTSWTPGNKKWKKILAAAASSQNLQVTFYWRAVGKNGGLVVSKAFILDKTK